MAQSGRMNWQVVRELGVVYRSPQPSAGPALHHPIVAERAADGSTLIVDKLGIEKALPFWLEYRTLRIAADGAVVFDSHAIGIHDGYGCLLPDGGIALLRVSRWEVLLFSTQGSLERTISLAALAKQPPLLIAATERASLLIAFVDRLYEVEIVEIGLDGDLLWHLAAGGPRFGCPASLQRLRNGNLLIADEFCSTATEIDRAGAIVWRFGKEKDPAKRPDRLSNPHGARELADGQRLIADTRNHRVLLVGHGGTQAIVPSGTTLCCPTSAMALGDGRTLVSDAGHRRVIELDADGRVVWQFGDGGIEQHLLSFPRSVECLGPDVYLVADTANDRVVRLRDGVPEAWPMNGTAQLFWPRCARLTPSGSLLVADGRNARVVELSPSGTVLNELHRVMLDGRELALNDPHDVRLLLDGSLLLTDAGIDLVAIVRWSGEVSWFARRGTGADLRDPHSAQQLDDGSLLVCDTGNSRVLRLDAAARIVDDVRMLRCGPVRYRFSRPRQAEIDAEGNWLVVDTGNNRILGADADRENAWSLTQLPDSPTPWLNQPRWVSRIGAEELLVTDHLHHRVLHLRRVGVS